MSAVLTEEPVVAVPSWMPDDLLQMPDAVAYELVDGRLVERNMGMKSVRCGTRIVKILGNFADDNQLGSVFDEGAGYLCFPDDPNKLRRADVSFIRFSRLADDDLPSGHCRIAPDLVVEVISPNDLYLEVTAKIQEWESAGVLLIWVVDPELRTVTVRRRGVAQPLELRGDDEITGEDVLPGFRCRISDFFPPARRDANQENGQSVKPANP